MSIEARVRIPFIPLDKNNTDITPSDREFIVDYETYETYINIDGVGVTKIPTLDNIKSMVQDEVDSLLGGVDNDGDSIEKLRDLISPLKQFMDDINGDTYDVSLSDIINFFNKLKNIDIVGMLDNKVDKDGDMILSERDFSDDLKAKLEGIEKGANRYIHPNEIQCDLGDIVNSVNGKTGAVSITRMDIAGLENVDAYANNYKHPSNQQCSHVFRVNKVHGMTGDVTINKSHLGLGNVVNLPPSKIEDLNKANECYLKTETLYKYLINHINNNI